jgi:uncharacterized protein YecE (DUF72 family)
MPAPIAYIGCPVWAHAPWVGRFFSREARREDFLPQYASVFNTAEGNATFYGIPKPDTVLKWREDSPDGFRFCFKFPKTISHGRQLQGAGALVAEFLTRMEPLGARLGPFFLQLEAGFGPAKLPILEEFLKALPRAHRYAVEVRHPDFFAGGEPERAFEAVLGRHGANRVLFDTTGLFASGADDASTREAQGKKPRVPLRESATAQEPFVRFVGDMDVERNRPALEAWADRLAAWIAQGRTPYFFTHHPDEAHAPELGRMLQKALHERLPSLPPPPAWPLDRAAGQLSLL